MAETKQAPSDDAIKGVMKTKVFKSKGDWLNQKLTEHATDKNDEGKVTGVSITKLKSIAKENGIKHRESYANPGMWRVNIGNMLRAKARREGVLLFHGKQEKVPDWKEPAPKAARTQKKAA